MVPNIPSMGIASPDACQIPGTCLSPPTDGLAHKRRAVDAWLQNTPTPLSLNYLIPSLSFRLDRQSPQLPPLPMLSCQMSSTTTPATGLNMPPYGQSLYRDLSIPKVQPRSLLPPLDIYAKPRIANVDDDFPVLGLNFANGRDRVEDGFKDSAAALRQANGMLEAMTLGAESPIGLKPQEIKSGPWMCPSALCRAHNVAGVARCQICGFPRPTSPVNLDSSRSSPSTPPRSASSSSTAFGPGSSPSSASSYGSAAFALPPNKTSVAHPPRFQTATSTTDRQGPAYSVPGFTSASNVGPRFENRLTTVYATSQTQLSSTTGLTPSQYGFTFDGPNTVPRSLELNHPAPQLPPTTPGNGFALHTVLAPSGLRLSQGGRVRNVCPDESSPVLMFWPDNEPLPTAGQCRPPLPDGYRSTNIGSKSSANLPPILNTGNVGPMAKQPLDWTCNVCGYTNWRRRKVCQCCFPYAPGNEPPSNHADRMKVVTALVLAAHHQEQRERDQTLARLPPMAPPLTRPIVESQPAGTIGGFQAYAPVPTPAPKTQSPPMAKHIAPLLAMRNDLSHLKSIWAMDDASLGVATKPCSLAPLDFSSEQRKLSLAPPVFQPATKSFFDHSRTGSFTPSEGSFTTCSTLSSTGFTNSSGAASIFKPIGNGVISGGVPLGCTAHPLL